MHDIQSFAIAVVQQPIVYFLAVCILADKLCLMN
jgi:hypothetical protein